MGPSFLTPAFFLGLAALAIPVLIHLTHREKKEIVEFPSLMFLRRIPYRSVRRQRIRQWLLFFMRALALVLLVLAFSRPYWERPGRASAAMSGARDIVVLIDRSYSMGYADRWDRARQAAHDAVDDVQPDDRATLIAFSDRAEVLNQATSDRSQLHALVDELRVGSGVTRYAPALEMAAKILTESNLPRRNVFLITDFQKIGWEGQENVQLPAGTILTSIDLSDDDTSNMSVTSVVLDREFLEGRERVVASARIANKGERPREDVSIQLDLGARRLQEKTLRVDANSAETVTFEPFALPEGISRGRVRLAGDTLPQDDAFYFVLWPGQSLSVLVLEGSEGGRGSLYLGRALSLGNRPTFEFEVKSFARFRDADLQGRSVVMLNDVPPPSERVGGRLAEFVEAGGGLLVILGERSGAVNWAGRAAELLPGSWGPPIDRSEDWGGTLSFIDYSHPIFEIFAAPRSGDFSAAKFFRYRPLSTETADAVLARFDDGAVALAEKRVGKGRVLVWTSTLDAFWNDLALQPVYLPFIHLVTRRASGYAEAEHWYTVGDVLDLTRYLDVAEASVPLPGGYDRRQSEWIMLKPSGGQSLLSLEDGETVLSLDEQGFYDVRMVDSGDVEPFGLAVNLDPTESDLSSMDPEELAAAVVASGETDAAATAAEWTAEDREKSQSVWWFLLIAAFVVFAAETVLSNRLSRLAR